MEDTSEGFVCECYDALGKLLDLYLLCLTEKGVHGELGEQIVHAI